MKCAQINLDYYQISDVSRFNYDVNNASCIWLQMRRAFRCGIPPSLRRSLLEFCADVRALHSENRRIYCWSIFIKAESNILTGERDTFETHQHITRLHIKRSRNFPPGARSKMRAANTPQHSTKTQLMCLMCRRCRSRRS